MAELLFHPCERVFRHISLLATLGVLAMLATESHTRALTSTPVTF